MNRPRKRQLKTSEVLARDIINDIRRLGLKENDMLPSEAVMLEQYQIGRNSLREALRLLESQGLVVVRSGPGGGPVVGTASPSSLGRTSSLFFRFVGATYQDVADAVLEFNPHLASLAAGHKGNEHLKDLMRESIEQSRHDGHPEDAPVGHLMDFHTIVREMSGNPVLALYGGAIDTLFYEHVVRSIDTTPIHAAVVVEHAAIADAILAGKPDAARELMLEHMQASVDFCKAQVPGIFSQPVEWR